MLIPLRRTSEGRFLWLVILVKLRSWLMALMMVMTSRRKLSSLPFQQVDKFVPINSLLFYTYNGWIGYVQSFSLLFIHILVCSGADTDRHTKMLEDIRVWSSNSPSPSNLFLIMGDSAVDFKPVIESLVSSRHYKIHYVKP